MDLPTLTVDTTHGYKPDLDQIVSFAMQSTVGSAERNRIPEPFNHRSV